MPLPDGRMMTKQCFWLNNTYIAEQIADLDNSCAGKGFGRRVTPVAQGKIVRINSKSERYNALSPECKKIVDAVEVAVSVTMDKLTEKATDKVIEIIDKIKRK